MSSVHEVIEAFRRAPSNAERGAKLEQLMVRFFELDPMLSARYDRVWRWVDWPGHRGADTGIDLVADIASSPIDWDIVWPNEDLHVTMAPARRHEIRRHQQVAIDEVFEGFAAHDRGKLVMACGTGKTFTA